MIISQKKLVTTHYYKEEKSIVSVYKGRVNLEFAVAKAEDVLAFTKNNEGVAGLIDIRGLDGSFVKLEEYYTNTYPAIVDSGLKYIAFVVSDDLMSNNLASKFGKLASAFGVDSAIF